MESDVLFKKNGILQRYNLLLGRTLASWLGFMEKMGGCMEGGMLRGGRSLVSLLRLERFAFH